MTARSDEAAGCIFCSAASAPDPRSSLTLYSDSRLVVMLNRYPYTNGHLMVAPAEHVSRLWESDRDALSAIIMASAESQRILSDQYHPDGFNVGMNFGTAAGAGVADHYHVHVVPRWTGDSNFMSVTAETRMIPEELETTWEKLRPKFAGLGAVIDPHQ